MYKITCISIFLIPNITNIYCCLFWILTFLPLLYSLFLFSSSNSVSPQDKGSEVLIKSCVKRIAKSKAQREGGMLVQFEQ